LPALPALVYQRPVQPPRRKALRVFIAMVIDIIDLLINVVVMLVIIQFVLSLLISVNVVNTHNDFVRSFWTGINAVLEPVLRPIRRILPATGGIDFSPLVLILGLQILRRILYYIAATAVS